MISGGEGLVALVAVSDFLISNIAVICIVLGTLTCGAAGYELWQAWRAKRAR